MTRPLPVVAHKGPYDTDAAMFERAAWNLEHGYALGGGNLTDAVVRLIRREVTAANQQVRCCCDGGSYESTEQIADWDFKDEANEQTGE